MEGVASFAAVLVKENGTDSSDIILVGTPPTGAFVEDTERLDVGQESQQDQKQLHPPAVERRVLGESEVGSTLYCTAMASHLLLLHLYTSVDTAGHNWTVTPVLPTKH